MKSVVFLLMFISAISNLNADLPATPICTASGEQSQPDIDNDWIVWHDSRNGPSNCDIFGYILTEPNEVQICTESGHQRYVAVNGGIAVWQDERNSQRDIRAFDLVNRVPLDLPNMPLNDGIYQRYPDISDNVIIYEHMTGGYYNLFAYDVAAGTSTQIAPASYNQINSAMDGTVVIWTENHGVAQVYYRDLSKAMSAVPVSSSGFGQYNPALSGDIIVWAEDRGIGTGNDIYRYDLSEGQEYVVYSGSGDQTHAAISGDLVIWQDEAKGTSNFDLWGQDIKSGAPFAIATSDQHDQNAAIYGRRVVWQRGTSDNFDIYMTQIPTPSVIALVYPNGGQQLLAGSAIEISWQMVDGVLPEYVKIEFSSNNGTDWQVIEAAAASNAPYLWHAAAVVDSAQCLIRISDAADSIVSDISDTAFRIFQCDPAMTADLTGDCFVGIEDFAFMAAQWLTCGNPYNAEWCSR